jgi:hypothetical protein
MSRPDPIEYAERLYAAIRDANFSPISFLAFGNAVKDGVPMRSMPRIAVEPFMRVVGEMLNLEEEAEVIDAEVATSSTNDAAGALATADASPPAPEPEGPAPVTTEAAVAAPPSSAERRRTNAKRAQ